MDVRCIGCDKTPEEINEYVEAARRESTPRRPMTPTQYVQSDEGTYNRANGHFVCTEDYIAMGQPSSPQGWKAP